MENWELEVVQRAARQGGVVQRAQVLRAGMSRHQLERRVRAGAWVTLFPGVYRVEGAPRGWLQDVQGLALWAGRDFAFSHRTAAALHGFRRYPAGALELTTHRDLRAPQRVTLHRVAVFAPRDVVVVRNVPTTSVTRTLLDLAGVESLPDLRAATDEALQRKWTTVARLAAAVKFGPRARGLVNLRQLVREYEGGDGPTESELEARVFECLEEAGLPRPRRQRGAQVAGRRYRLDFCFVEQQVIIEADGYATHSSAEAFERDRARNNRLTARGFRVLHWTWDALETRPAELLAELRAMLAAPR